MFISVMLLIVSLIVLHSSFLYRFKKMWKLLIYENSFLQSTELVVRNSSHDFQLETIKGKSLTRFGIQSNRDYRIVLIATYSCSACHLTLEELAEEFEEQRPIVYLVVDQENEFDEFVEKYPNCEILKGEKAFFFESGITSAPVLLILDKNSLIIEAKRTVKAIQYQLQKLAS